MPYAAPPLRAAAAAARELLREAAAERFGLPVADLTVAGGIVAGPDGAPSVGYPELLAGVRRVEKVPAGGPVTPPAAWRSAGRPARAAGGADVVTGVKRFPADLRADGMLHGCVLRAAGVRRHAAPCRHRAGRGAARGERGRRGRLHRGRGPDRGRRAPGRQRDRRGLGPLAPARAR